MNPIFGHPTEETVFGSPPRADAVALAKEFDCTLLDLASGIVRAMLIKGLASKYAYADMDTVMSWAKSHREIVHPLVPVRLTTATELSGRAALRLIIEAADAIDRWPAVRHIVFQCTCGLKMEVQGPLTKREHETLESFRDKHVRGHAKLAKIQSIG